MARVAVGHCTACGRELRVKDGAVRPKMRLTCTCGQLNEVGSDLSDEILLLLHELSIVRKPPIALRWIDQGDWGHEKTRQLPWGECPRRSAEEMTHAVFLWMKESRGTPRVVPHPRWRERVLRLERGEEVREDVLTVSRIAEDVFKGCCYRHERGEDLFARWL